jgi:hypothetical protein
MGTFLAMSGVAGARAGEVENALRDFASARSGTLAPLITPTATDDDDFLLIAESEQGNVTVSYPCDFIDWDGASQHLSTALKRPVFSLHIHDGDLWMYLLFADGQEVDRFNPLPDYWEELSDDEIASWSGDASVVAKYWPGVRVEQVANYLVRWEADAEEPGAKAYPGDEYAAGEDWQMVDFMAKVGLVFPGDEEGEPLGTRYRFTVPG